MAIIKSIAGDQIGLLKPNKMKSSYRWVLQKKKLNFRGRTLYERNITVLIMLLSAIIREAETANQQSTKINEKTLVLGKFSLVKITASLPTISFELNLITFLYSSTRLDGVLTHVIFIPNEWLLKTQLYFNQFCKKSIPWWSSV